MDLTQGENLVHVLAVIRTTSGLPSDILWIVAVWFLMVGGCFGSLMNVIIYRWPAGLSIVAPGSRCPRCLHPIRLYDNVPVLSWILLGARCRDCRAPIPIRYPLVEAVVAVLFFTFFIVDVINIRPDLPSQATYAPRIYWGTYGLNMLLICMLICAALIEFDGKKLPAKLIWPPLLIAILATTRWPELRPALNLLPVDSETQRLAGVLGTAAGILVGVTGGWLVGSVSAFGRKTTGRFSATALASVIGAVVGWQGVLLVCIATSIFILFAQFELRLRPRVRLLPDSAYVTVGTLLFLLYWRLIEQAVGRLAD